MLDISVKKILQLTGHQGSVFALTQGRTPQHVLSGAGDGWIVEWDLANPEQGQLLAKVDSNIFSLLYLSADKRIVAGNMNGGVHFVDLENSLNSKNIQHHSKGVFDIQIIENQLFTIGGEGNITRWSVEETRTIESLQISAKSLRCMDYSLARKEIVVGASDGNIYFLDLELNLKQTIKTAHDNSVFSIKYAPDGNFLISGGRDAQLKIWDLNAQKGQNTEGVLSEKMLLSSQSAHWFTINSIAFHPKNPQIFATASRDKTIKIWELPDGFDFNENKNLDNFAGAILLKVLDIVRDGCHINSVNKLYWSDYQDVLISCSDDRSLIAWEINI